jgi:hypothetical protein
MKVLCITGWCRNGSTILGNVLNEVPGFFHVGELHFLWKNSIGRGANGLCGCGQMLVDCPIWSPIISLEKPDGLTAEQYADEVIRRQRATVRTRHTWRVLKRGLNGEDIRKHAVLMTRTYQAIAASRQAEVIVDTTKIPGEAALLTRLDGITPYYVHLVRDPRAVAQSWQAPKDYVYALSASRSTAYWTGFNVASEAITQRYPEQSMFLRYEDFIADPAGTVDELLRFCEADPAGNPMSGSTVELNPNHTVTGNPDRFRTGPTEIRASDDSWRTKLPAPARRAALALSWPVRRKYGYSTTNVDRSKEGSFHGSGA